MKQYMVIETFLPGCKQKIRRQREGGQLIGVEVKLLQRSQVLRQVETRKLIASDKKRGQRRQALRKGNVGE